MMKKKPLSIYIHIPFCVKKCNYCDFLSGPATNETKARYIETLKDEIDSYKDLATKYEIYSIFIGGGTPSSIDAIYIKEIMEHVKTTFYLVDTNQIEITIEINPGTIDREKLETYYHCGVNRISFGLQSANNEELKMLGRIHTFEEFVANYEMAREIGFQNINIDLMSALPGQTMKSYLNTLEQVMALRPEHISAYSLIIEEGTPFYELYGRESKLEPTLRLPTEDEDREMYEKTKSILHAHGYERYEISNYAKQGYECKHNCVYWQRGDYLGLGTGAASLLEEKRFHNTNEMDTYVKKIRNHRMDELHEDVEVLDERSQMEEFMFLGLRMMKGVSKEKFYQTFGKQIEEVYGNILSKMTEQKLLVEKKGFIALTEEGINISNYVMSEFLQ